MTQALIAEVPEFDFLAAVEETGSLNLDLSVHNSSSINLLAKKKQPVWRMQTSASWTQIAPLHRCTCTETGRRESFQLSSNWGEHTKLLGSVITEGRLPLLGPGLIKPRGFDGRGERITEMSGGRMTTGLTPGLRSFGSWQTDLKGNSSLKWVTYRVYTGKEPRSKCINKSFVTCKDIK